MDTPTPQSYSDILGAMVDAFLSRTGLRALKIGSAILTALESAAQSDLRASDDLFTLLDSSTLDNATGLALERIGADENVAKITQSPASGTVDFSDISFTKVSTKIFQGGAAPIVGTTTLNVTDASALPTTFPFNIYIGRGLTSFEGPISVTGKTQVANYWQLTLSTGTQKFHNVGEPITLAQGGDRLIGAGTVVKTAAGNLADAVRYKTLYQATIPDGETQVVGVAVVALKPGLSGNVAFGAISAFDSKPFTGAVVTNPTAITNGLATEDDDTYRERIRDARASRTKGTPLALVSNSVGVVSTDENKRVISAAYVGNEDEPGILYIDDGTGYEEITSGVASETFFDYALGGEQFAKVANRPVAKAHVQALATAPFALAAGMELSFSVGGVTTTHTFSADQYRAIGNATGYEVVADVNSDFNLNWGLRTINGGTGVVAFAKADTNEAIEVAASTNDANAVLGFPSALAATLWLYKNDVLLSKDGAVAALTANHPNSWGTFGSSEDLQLEVDGCPLTALVGGTYTFTAADFIAADTGYAAVGKNTPAAWAAVFNYRVPGITATVVGDTIVLTSNRGLSSKAKLRITGGSLVAKGMFSFPNGQTVLVSQGADSDYVFNRNTGEFKLAEPLSVGDRVSAGSVNTRAFLQSPAISTVSITDGHVWVAVDDGATIVATGLTASTPVQFTTTSKSWGLRQRMTQSSGTGMFSSVAIGDWLVMWDTQVPGNFFRHWVRVSAIAADGSWVEWDAGTLSNNAGTPTTLTSAGIAVARTSGQLQHVAIATNTSYTATTLAAQFSSLLGATASVYQTQTLRLRTNTFGFGEGDIAVVAQDTAGARAGLPLANATVNVAGHLASVETANDDVGTPDFHQAFVSAVASTTSITGVWNPDPDSFFTSPGISSQVVGLRPFPDGTTNLLGRYGNNKGFVTPMTSTTSLGGGSYTLALRTAVSGEWVPGERLLLARPWDLASDDTLSVLVDGDVDSHRYVVPMWRTLKTQGTTYGSTNTFKDADNGNATLATAFGYGSSGFAFEDFAVYMAARGKTDAADTTKAILWRYYRLGPDGNFARVQYQNPTTASAPVGFSVDNSSSQYTNVSITLPSGAARTGYTLSSNTFLGHAITSAASGMGTIAYVLGLQISSASRTSNVTTLTLTLPGAVLDHGLTTGDVIWVNSTSGLFSSGAKTLLSGSGTTLTYAETAADQVATPNIGDVSKDSSARATLSGGNQVNNDFFYLGSTLSWRPSTKSMAATFTNSTWTGQIPYSGATSTTLAWSQITDTTAFQILTNPQDTSAALVTAFNASVAGNTQCPVSATLVSDGTGTIIKSSDETAAASPTWVQLTDGINYVQTTTIPGSSSGDYQLAFKNAITASLATSSDWANEVVKVVPRTTKNAVDWFNVLAVTGLSSAAEVARSDRARKVQFISSTVGSDGSVEVQGGTANAATTALVGAALTVSPDNILVTVRTADVAGFQALSYVDVDNAEALPKTSAIGADTHLLSITSTATTSTLTFSVDGPTPGDGLGVPLWTYSQASSSSVLAMVEKQGDYVAIVDTGFGTALGVASASEGDWIQIQPPATVTYPSTNPSYNAVATIAAGNCGCFRVVRVVKNGSYAMVYIRNSAAVEQALVECDVQFFTPDSVQLGDQLRVSTSLWDGAASNKGVYTVTALENLLSGTVSRYVMTVTPAMSAVAVSPGVLGTSSPLVQIIEATPLHYVKRILSIAPNQSDSTLTDIKFSTNPGASKMSAAAGTVLTARDKLAFPTSTVVGVDGYQYSTGLIAAVNQVIYGDPSDTATYPGVVAAKAKINIQGSPIKRIQLTIGLRLRTGANRTEVSNQVKNAIAAVVNQAGTGVSVALSDITKAAGKVGDVESAVMVNPAATSTTDLINVQPYEKPMVLDADTDISVVFIGQ